MLSHTRCLYTKHRGCSYGIVYVAICVWNVGNSCNRRAAYCRNRVVSYNLSSTQMDFGIHFNTFWHTVRTKHTSEMFSRSGRNEWHCGLYVLLAYIIVLLLKERKNMMRNNKCKQHHEHHKQNYYYWRGVAFIFSRTNSRRNCKRVVDVNVGILNAWHKPPCISCACLCLAKYHRSVSFTRIAQKCVNYLQEWLLALGMLFLQRFLSNNVPITLTQIIIIAVYCRCWQHFLPTATEKIDCYHLANEVFYTFQWKFSFQFRNRR